jgi:hypothetical protein
LALLFVGVFAIVNRHDADNVLALVNAIEETKLTQAVSPSFWLIPLEFFDVGSVVRLFFNLRAWFFLVNLFCAPNESQGQGGT